MLSTMFPNTLLENSKEAVAIGITLVTQKLV